MAAGDTDIGTGATITFGTSAYTAELLSLDASGMNRVSVQTSHMGSSNHTFVPGDLVDYGELRCSWHFKASVMPPIAAVPETIVIVLPEGSTWTFADAFMTDFEFGVPLEDVMTAEGTLKASTLPVIT